MRAEHGNRLFQVGWIEQRIEVVGDPLPEQTPLGLDRRERLDLAQLAGGDHARAPGVAGARNTESRSEAQREARRTRSKATR